MALLKKVEEYQKHDTRVEQIDLLKDSVHEYFGHPQVYPTRYTLDDAIHFFLAEEVLGGCFDMNKEIIEIWAFCSHVNKDLPDMSDVVYTIDHEYMHWLLYVFIDDWKSTCFDEICRKIEPWVNKTV